MACNSFFAKKIYSLLTQVNGLCFRVKLMQVGIRHLFWPMQLIHFLSFSVFSAYCYPCSAICSYFFCESESRTESLELMWLKKNPFFLFYVILQSDATACVLWQHSEDDAVSDRRVRAGGTALLLPQNLFTYC